MSKWFIGVVSVSLILSQGCKRPSLQAPKDVLFVDDYMDILQGDHAGLEANGKLLVDCVYHGYGDHARECKLVNGATLDDVMTAAWRIHGHLATMADQIKGPK